ncbi:flagellar basal body rod protein FlgB [Massilia sp. CCM 8733]|uniref:Flagellar basal body rod protein FlgB n=1 Tax=Massilia mucilaginosa TaxID=2609282 RepID=A0ABX0NSW7_9BURK|nr:flagellar basal body rod protein FlgB [Massilia mucilaginosa]NHZ89947.1 flagellar basal body rod protein FlgB [Massilia mucilaginosa]
MFGSTEAVTVDMVRLALDAASLRQQTIAHNIANVNTPGFAPARVDFEQQMGAARAALDQGQPVTAAMLGGVRPVVMRLAPSVDADRSAMLDLEVADMAQNTVHYQALVKALGKHMSIMSSAVAEGKR